MKSRNGLVIMRILILLELFSINRLWAQTPMRNFEYMLKAKEWMGKYTLIVKGPVRTQIEGSDEVVQSTMNQTITTKCLLGRDPLIVSGFGWKTSSGRIEINIDDESWSNSPGVKIRSTNRANSTQEVSAATHNFRLQLERDRPFYTLHWPQFRVRVQGTRYQQNKPNAIDEGPYEHEWTIPGADFKDIPSQAASGKLTGTRVMKIMVSPPAGDGGELEAQFQWELEPAPELAPLK
jgi:hypothetical protein